MANHGDAPPSVRRYDDRKMIEIDQKRGEWPFLVVARDDKGGLVVHIDANPREMLGQGTGAARIRIGRRKSRELLTWLLETDDDVTFEDEG